MGNNREIEGFSIVAFEWRGRRLRFLGELNFQDLQKLYANRLFYRDRDDRGRFQKVKIYDSSGAIVSDDDPGGLVGCINFDNEYETIYCKRIEDCNDMELELIKQNDGIYLTSEMLKY